MPAAARNARSIGCAITLAVWLAWPAGARAADPAPDAAAPDFERQIVPLLKNRCVQCHGPAKREGKLNLSLPPGIVRGGESGRSIVPGQPDDSLLWQRVAADEMPEDQPLPAAEKELLRRWIAAGAAGLPEHVAAEPSGDEHWAFQPLVAPPLPAVRDGSRLRTPVDNFILARLEAAGLSLAPEAGRPTLIRRVSFDLTGLPPTPAEIAQFVGDTSERAYEALVERYLASPHYAERWGKYWLDAAGYADSNGYFAADTDRPLAFRYRDYVIRSIAADKPFDRFIVEQLAGDELAGYRPGAEIRPDMIELLTATHFLRNSPDGTDNSDGNEEEVRADRYAVLEGSLQIMGSTLLGMTVQCARCHDHKFEPLTQRDYYHLQAVLYPAFNVETWRQPKDRNLSAATPAELAVYHAELTAFEARLAERHKELADWVRQHREPAGVVWADAFDEPERRLTDRWSNAAPGDTAPAGEPPVNVDSSTAPGALVADGKLQIIESRAPGDRAISTRQIFDWTPDQLGAWVQVTFDLVEPAEYVGYFIALRDFGDATDQVGGNILVDGHGAGGAGVHIDYPGAGDRSAGMIGESGYTAGRNYGVRVTNVGEGQVELAQLVDGLVEKRTLKLAAGDLPDGGFGFEYCCGRSFTVDNIIVEAADTSPEAAARRTEIAAALEAHQAAYDKEIKALESEKPGEPGRISATTDPGAEAPDVYLLERGVYEARQEKVGAGAPALLAGIDNPADFAPPADAAVPADAASGSTGRRGQLARWLTHPGSRSAALLARVTVNRWWQHHFATGIAATTDNLGYSGTPPTHAALLEYLAAEFVRTGWSAKAVHRELVCSATYRQSSLPRADAAERDPDNRLLWRYPLRRLDAEAIRDAMLAIAGQLDPKQDGPYVPAAVDAEGDVVVDEKTPSAHCRSVYLQQRRTQVPGILAVFDAPSITFNCTLRMPTTVPLQSLKLLNSSFVRARAEALARRVAQEAGDDPQARIERAFLLVCGRGPTAEESAASLEFLSTQPAEYAAADAAQDAAADGPSPLQRAWIDFANMLLASNAFLYLE